MADARVEARTGAEVLGGTRARAIMAVLAAAGLTALGARMSVPLPGTPVPVSMQSLVVILSGALLGARLGAIAQTTYLLAGALGAPVFVYGAGIAYLFGPTGGYLLAFPLAAAVAGRLVQGAADDGSFGGALRLTVAMLAGMVVIHAGGVAQLALLSGDAGQAVRTGTLPFLPGDLLKTVAAVLVTRRVGRRARALF